MYCGPFEWPAVVGQDDDPPWPLKCLWSGNHLHHNLVSINPQGLGNVYFSAVRVTTVKRHQVKTSAAAFHITPG